MVSLQRINFGRGHWYKIDGRKADGVTTLLGDGLPKPALINWAANTTAAYAVDNWDELSDLPVSERLTTLQKCRYGVRDAAGRRGTDVHRLAEELVHGREVKVPEELAGHVESYVKFLDEWKPRPLLVEASVGNRTWNYAGTLDLVAGLPDGTVAIWDVKTARSGIFPETALQMAAYANAELYLDADGDEKPMADLGITAGYAVHVRADGYDVRPVDIGPTAFKIFQHVMWLARQIKGPLKGLVGDAIDIQEATA